MALRALVIKKNLTEKRSELETLSAVDFATREAEIEKAIEEATTDEEKALVEEEIAKFDAEKAENENAKATLTREIEELETELNEVEKTVEERKETNTMEIRENIVTVTPEVDEKMEARKALTSYIRGEQRADYPMTKGNNGVVVPTEIAGEVIAEIKEISPLVAMAHQYNTNAKVVIPTTPASSSHKANAGYITEGTALEASSADFGNVTLESYSVGALSIISKSLIKNTDLDVVGNVKTQIAIALAEFIEKEMINGTSGKIAGLAGATLPSLTAGKKSSVTADELITLQGKVKGAYQRNAGWLMAPATRDAIRTLKDGEGRYLLAPDFKNDGVEYTLLGKPVYVSDNMPALGKANNKAIFYGDFSGLALKMPNSLEVEVLNEKYADMYAVGVIGTTEIDAKVENAQKLAVLVCGSADA